MRDTQRERGAETQAEGEAGSMHREPYMGFNPGSPGSRPGPKAGAKPLCHPGIPSFSFFIYLLYLFIFKYFIYLFTRDTQREREAETQAEGEAGSIRGARCGTRSWNPRITPWAKGRRSALGPPGVPSFQASKCMIIGQPVSELSGQFWCGGEYFKMQIFGPHTKVPESESMREGPRIPHLKNNLSRLT